MFSYIVRRLLIAIPVLFGVTIFNFLIIYLAPGNPVEMFIDPNTSADQIELRKEQLGLNDPLWLQYLHWLGNLLQGNLGFSYNSFEPVSQILAERLGPTLLLMGLSLLVGILIMIPLGIVSATKQYSTLDYATTGFSFLGISIPNFFLGLGLIYVFSLQFPLLPTGGMMTLGSDGGFLDRVQHLILPVVVLAIGIGGEDDSLCSGQHAGDFGTRLFTDGAGKRAARIRRDQQACPAERTDSDHHGDWAGSTDAARRCGDYRANFSMAGDGAADDSVDHVPRLSDSHGNQSHRCHNGFGYQSVDGYFLFDCRPAD
ncbi:UNVERIFIED_CONTAM: hypothetical protein ABID98_004876 [Brevibacillus sp. OAP136]